MMRTCPHCGCNTPKGTQHDAQCIALNHTKYRAMLNRGDGCITGYGEWGNISRQAGLYGCVGLMRVCNATSWRGVAEYFELGYNPTPGVVRNANPEVAAMRKAQRAALDAPLTDDERHACTRRGATEFGGEQGLHSRWSVVDVWR